MLIYASLANNAEGKLGEDLCALGAPSEHNHQQPRQARGQSTIDVPGGGLGEFSGESIADLIRDGMGCVHADDKQHNADDKKHDSKHSLRAHDGFLIKV